MSSVAFSGMIAGIQNESQPPKKSDAANTIHRGSKCRGIKQFLSNYL